MVDECGKSKKVLLDLQKRINKAISLNLVEYRNLWYLDVGHISGTLQLYAKMARFLRSAPYSTEQ